LGKWQDDAVNPKAKHALDRVKVCLLAGGVSLMGLALTTPAVGEDAPIKEQRREKETINSDEKGIDEHAGVPELPKCKPDGEKIEISSERDPDGGKQLVIIGVCEITGGGTAELIGQLEEEINELDREHDGIIVPAVKAEMIAKMRAKIAELRSRD
jgi:hypothetical protein